MSMEELPSPMPGPGQVAITIRSCGVNFPDLFMTEGKYQRRPDLPFSPGGEVAGIIRDVGAGVENYQPGDRVIAYVGYGGFAEEVVVDIERLMPMPAPFDFVQASAFMLTYGTALHALSDRGQLKAGETLLVLGAAGGVGIAAVEIGKLLGARVVAAASSAEKLAFCRAHGADDVIDYAKEDLRERLREITSGAGADVVCDIVGGAHSEPALRSTAWGGRFLVVGFATGEIARVPLNLPLLKVCAIVGVAWGQFVRRGGPAVMSHLAQLGRLAETGELVPTVTATYPLDQAAQALIDMRERRIKGKVVVVP
jgi:NADPH2:quinone reductase